MATAQAEHMINGAGDRMWAMMLQLNLRKKQTNGKYGRKYSIIIISKAILKSSTRTRRV